MKAKTIILGLFVLVLIVLAALMIYFRAGAELLADDALDAPEPTVEVIIPEETEEPTGEPEAPAETAEEPEATVEPEEPNELPDIDITSWEYRLANSTHSIGNYAPELEFVENSQQMDTNVADAMRDFIEAARNNGLSVYLSSAYRGYDEQSYLYERKVQQYGGDREKAATIVLPPGTSEHQTGLCADITDKYYELKNAELENTELFKWMDAHCTEYGFVLRYPKDKEEITNVIYEPWHFRYVGVEAAEYMKRNNLCLEEFVELYDYDSLINN